MKSKIAKILVILVVAAIGLPVLGAFVIGVVVGGQSESAGEDSREGYIEGNVFVNTPTKWRFSIPQGWQVQSEEEQQARYEVSKQMAKGQVEGDPTPRKNQTGELALSKADKSSFNFKANIVDAAKAPGLVEYVAEVTEASYKQHAERDGLHVESERSSRVIGGKEFQVAAFRVWNPERSTILVTNVSYMRLESDNRFILMTTNCASDESCGEILGAVESSTF